MSGRDTTELQCHTGNQPYETINVASSYRDGMTGRYLLVSLEETELLKLLWREPLLSDSLFFFSRLSTFFSGSGLCFWSKWITENWRKATLPASGVPCRTLPYRRRYRTKMTVPVLFSGLAWRFRASLA